MSLAVSSREQGATTIEFTLIFIVLFTLFYGLVGYTVPLLLASSYQDLAGDSLRHVIELRARPLHNMDYQQKVNELLAQSWLPEDWIKPCGSKGFLDTGESLSDESDAHSEIVWRVCIRHDNPASIIPPVTLFGLQVPPLPDEIRGEAAVRLF